MIIVADTSLKDSATCKQLNQNQLIPGKKIVSYGMPRQKWCMIALLPKHSRPARPNHSWCSPIESIKICCCCTVNQEVK